MFPFVLAMGAIADLVENYVAYRGWLCAGATVPAPQEAPEQPAVTELPIGRQAKETLGRHACHVAAPSHWPGYRWWGGGPYRCWWLQAALCAAAFVIALVMGVRGLLPAVIAICAIANFGGNYLAYRGWLRAEATVPRSGGRT